MFENIYGLSCVENQVLAILKERGMDITDLYNDSAMPMKDLFFYLVQKGEKQENFAGLPRIQDVLKNIGLISLKLRKQENIENVRSAIRRGKENDYFLIRVTPEFTKSVLRARGFRADHYVLVKKASAGFEMTNDIPPQKLTLAARELTPVYGGDYFKLTVKRSLDDDDRRCLWTARKYKPEKFEPTHYFIRDFDNIHDLVVRLRNLAGVLKLLRCRLAEYYGHYFNTDFILEKLPAFEKHYAALEYFNLKRPGYAFEKCLDLFRHLNDMDTVIMLELKQRILESKNPSLPFAETPEERRG